MIAKTPAPKSKSAAKRAPAAAAVPAKAASAPKAKSAAVAAAPAAPTAKAVPVVAAPEPVAAVAAPAPVAETPVPETPATEAPAAELLAEPVVEAPAETPASTPTVAKIIPLVTVINPLNFVKEPIMATNFESTQDAVRTTVNTLNAQTEAAVNNGKAAMEQVAAKSKEAVEASMKSLDELSDMARANVDALISSARVATSGVEQVMTHLTEVSKKSFEESTAMVKGMAGAKTPNELMQMQSDFAKAQFDSVVAEYSKLTEMMVKLAGDVMEPVQNQVAIAADKMKSAFTTK